MSGEDRACPLIVGGSSSNRFVDPSVSGGPLGEGCDCAFDIGAGLPGGLARDRGRTPGRDRAGYRGRRDVLIGEAEGSRVAEPRVQIGDTGQTPLLRLELV